MTYVALKFATTTTDRTDDMPKNTYVGIDSEGDPLYVGDTVMWDGREWTIHAGDNLKCGEEIQRAAWIGYGNTVAAWKVEG